MCGIIGFVGERDAAARVFEGLKNLEYRGYDSAGAAFVAGGSLRVVKRRGTVDNLQPLLAGINAEIGIGHTRWATHGAPSDRNAHPHVAGDIAVVHNGIIENYAALADELKGRGARFLSETDSEIIAHLAAENYKGDLLSALAAAVKRLKGSYAVMAICAGGAGIAAAKYKSPVIVGYGADGYYLSSDEPALAGKCDKITVLKDGDMAYVTRDGVSIYDENLQPVEREIIPLTAKSESLELGDCPHYMLKELRAAPATVKNTLSAFKERESELSKVVKGVKRVIFVGCGTAYHAGLAGAVYVERIAKIPASAETAGEFRYRQPVLGDGTLVVAVSQSGETADTLEGAETAKRAGAKLVAVTNSLHSRLARISPAVVPVAAGAEICVAATKSYIGQVVALLCLAHLLADGSADGVIKDADALSRLCSETEKCVDLYALAHMCARSDGVYFLGRGIDYAVALEGSLKLKEVSYIQSEGYPAGELKHGTLALIDGGKVCVILATERELWQKYVSSAEQVLARGGVVAVLTNIDEIGSRLKGRAHIIKIPECGSFLSPLVCGIGVQYLAYRTAVICGNNPDKPRNLAKSVTVE